MPAFFERNFLTIFHERKLKNRLMCEEGEECEDKKSVKGNISCVHINDSVGSRFLFNNYEWTWYTILLQLLNKYIVRLFYDQEISNHILTKSCSLPVMFLQGFIYQLFLPSQETTVCGSS